MIPNPSAWTDTDLAAVAASWLEASRSPDSARDDAIEQAVVMLTFTAPAELQWSFIEHAVALAVSDEDLSHIAAGPFEGLFGRSGEAFIERLEARCAVDPRFARMTTMAWQYAISDAVWSRIQACGRG